MADDATDTAFGFIIFILFLALLGYAAGGGSWPSSTADTTTADPTTSYPDNTTTTSTSRSETNIPGGKLESCPGKIVANKTARSSNGNLNLKIYYSDDNDRNCAVATRVGWWRQYARSDDSQAAIQRLRRHPMAGVCGGVESAAHDSTRWRLPRRHLQSVHLGIRHLRALHGNGQGLGQHRPQWLQLIASSR